MNKLALGTVQFGINYGINNSHGIPSDKELDEILNFASKSGVKIIDTAIAYGNCEERLGNLMKNDFRIISKFSGVVNEKDLNKFITQTLNKLKCSKLYGFLAHNSNDLIKNNLIWDYLKNLKLINKVQKIGYSVYDTGQLEELIELGFIPDIIQLPYNLLDRQFERYFEILKQHKVEIHVRSIFLQGLYFMTLNKLPIYLSPLKKDINFLHSICENYNISMASLAMNFVKQNSYIDHIVMGVESKKQLEENTMVLNEKLNQKIIDLVLTINVKNKNLLNPVNWE